MFPSYSLLEYEGDFFMRKTAESKSDTLASLIIKCLINALISLLIFIILTLIITALCASGTYIKDNSEIILFASLLICCTVNGAVNAFTVKLKAIFSSSISALFFMVLLFLLFIVVNGFTFTFNSLICLFISITVTVISAVIYKNIRR